MTNTPTKDPGKPDYTRAEVTAVAEDLTLVADLLAGTRRMWDKASTYIRKWKDEDDEVYKIRSKSETVFEGLGRTLSAATGMLFAKAPNLEWNGGDPEMKAHWMNIDAAGTAGDVFIKRFADMALRDGLGVILVDHPSPPPGEVVTAATEQKLGLRPTWAMYSRAQVINWRTDVIDNKRTLTLLVLKEAKDVPSGDFGNKIQVCYRVLRLIDGQATWAVYTEVTSTSSATKEFVLQSSGTFRNRAGKVADFLPVAIGYTGRSDAPLTATIPLMGVAWANLAHWQTSTDLRFLRSLCAFPQPVVIGKLQDEQGPLGLVPGRLRVGPMVGIHLKEEGSSFSWAELSGTSLEQLVKGVLEKLQQMAQQGMSFLLSDTRAAETAEAKRLDATAENSTLATAAQGIDDATNLAHEYHAWYLGIDKSSAPVFTLNRDYESTAMDPQTMAAYVGAVRDAGLPVRLLLEAWQKGGRIPPDADLDELETEMMANSFVEADYREHTGFVADDASRA